MSHTNKPYYVIKSLEIMFFEASPQINAFCLDYMISQMSLFVDTNPEKVKRALERMVVSDFITSLRIVKMMYFNSPRQTKLIGKKLAKTPTMRVFKTMIKPLLRFYRT